MKKLIVFLCILGFCASAYGDNQARMSELTNEAQSLQQNLTRYNQTIQNIQIRIVEIRAILSERQRQNKEELTEKAEIVKEAVGAE